MTPARRHYQAVTAGAEAVRAATAATTGADAPAPLRDRMLALLQAHTLALKAIKSRKRKIETKRTILPEYAAYIDGVLAADAGGSDLVLVTLMVWSIDAGDYAAALRIGAYAVKHRLELPDTYKRDLQTTLVEEIADAVLQALAAAELPATGAADALDQALDITEGGDMPDEVRAKAHKALGLLRRESSPAAALADLRLALTFDGGCGVKTEIGRLERLLANANQPDPEAAASASPPDAGTGPTD